ncbi:TPA: hypothetical protein ACGUUK_004296 [Vibrio vulnificus]
MIWDEWAQHYKELNIESSRICKDGVINLSEWTNCDSKVLFVLKEVNGGSGEDLLNLLANGPKYQMWHTIARWAAGIQNNFPDYDSINCYETMKKALARISSINLKKTSGGSSSNMSVINSYAKADRKLLLKQINEIKPKIIVAGGTFDSLIWLLDLKVDIDAPTAKPVFDPLRNIWVIPWRHPGRVNNRDSYAELGRLYSTINSRFA